MKSIFIHSSEGEAGEARENPHRYGEITHTDTDTSSELGPWSRGAAMLPAAPYQLFIKGKYKAKVNLISFIINAHFNNKYILITLFL